MATPKEEVSLILRVLTSLDTDASAIEKSADEASALVTVALLQGRLDDIKNHLSQVPIAPDEDREFVLYRLDAIKRYAVRAAQYEIFREKYIRLIHSDIQTLMKDIGSLAAR